jgi:hypothetical protein
MERGRFPAAQAEVARRAEQHRRVAMAAGVLPRGASGGRTRFVIAASMSREVHGALLPTRSSDDGLADAATGRTTQLRRDDVQA